jgi:hypothetical protein
MYNSPFESDYDEEYDTQPVVSPSPFELINVNKNVGTGVNRSSRGLKTEKKKNIAVREIPELRYHYGEDKDYVLMGKDLYDEKDAMSCNVSWACFVSALLEFSVFSWPIVAFSIWGIRLDTIYTLVFAIHLMKGLLLSVKVFTHTMVFRMRGRNSYHWLWGIWTRTSHVHEDPILYMYGVLYGWIQIPMMCLYILVSTASYPLYTSIVTYWINWPMAIVSLIVGYIAWCVLISERSIRMELEKRVDFTKEQREQTRERESKRAYMRFGRNV